MQQPMTRQSLHPRVNTEQAKEKRSQGEIGRQQLQLKGKAILEEKDRRAAMDRKMSAKANCAPFKLQWTSPCECM